MTKLNKKGFTIIELVIVIAVIAILAAVLIPTFSSLIKTVQTSADVTLVKNVNLALASERAAEGNNATMQDALDDALEGGYDVTKLTPTNSENYILWDQTSDNFVLFANGKYNSCGADVNVDENALYKLWNVTSETEGSVYSVYYTGTDTEVNVDGVGFDAGKSDVTLINYKNTTGTEKDVIIRTNSVNTNMTIDAATDTVSHYGKVGKVDAVAVDMDCYNEYGSATYVKVTAGKVVVKDGGEISIVYVNNENSADAVVTVNGGSVEQGYTKAADAGASNMVLIQKEESEVEIVADDAIKDEQVEEVLVDNSNVNAWIDMPLDDVALEGSGTESDPYKITNALQLALVSKNIKNNVAANEGSVAYDAAYYVLMNNIDLAAKEWTPIGSGSYPFHGTFDGAGKTISNIKLDQKNVDLGSWGITDSSNNQGSAYGFFGIIGWKDGAHESEKVTIKNLTLDVSFETNGATAFGGLVGADAAGHRGTAKNSELKCDIELSNITVNGKVISTNTTGATVGGIAGKLYTQGNITIDSCVNNAEVKSETSEAKDSKVGGVLGFYSGANNVKITNNINNGKIVSQSSLSSGSKAAGICLTGATETSINISNNVNNGDVYGTENAVAAIAFSANDKPIYLIASSTVADNVNTGKLYTINCTTAEAEAVSYTYLVYGGKSQTPANNTTDDYKYEDGSPILEINKITTEQ